MSLSVGGQDGRRTPVCRSATRHRRRLRFVVIQVHDLQRTERRSMQIDLRREDAEIVRDLLRRRIVELDKEINRTDAFAFKRELQLIDRAASSAWSTCCPRRSSALSRPPTARSRGGRHVESLFCIGGRSLAGRRDRRRVVPGCCCRSCSKRSNAARSSSGPASRQVPAIRILAMLKSRRLQFPLRTPSA